MKIHIETERLILRNLTPDDWQAAFRWCGDPDVNRFMIYPLYTKAEDVKTLWLDNLDPDDPDSYEAGIVLKESGELIGSAGMYYKPEEDLWTIGYNLRKDQWGHGYAVETMRGLLEHVRKKTTQKVNLFEKVQIPGYQEAIRKIKRFMEDEENLSKSSQKILKALQEKRKEATA